MFLVFHNVPGVPIFRVSVFRCSCNYYMPLPSIHLVSILVIKLFPDDRWYACFHKPLSKGSLTSFVEWLSMIYRHEQQV